MKLSRTAPTPPTKHPSRRGFALSRLSAQPQEEAAWEQRPQTLRSEADGELSGHFPGALLALLMKGGALPRSMGMAEEERAPSIASVLKATDRLR